MVIFIGKGYKFLNLILWKEFGLYVNVWLCLSIFGYKICYDNVDFIIICENIEGEYSGLEY